MSAKTAEQFIKDIWTDDAVREQLFSDPKGFLKDHGVELADETEVEVHEETLVDRHFVLPRELTGEVPDSDHPVIRAFTRAFEDDSYRALLLRDPKAAVAELGVQVPDGLHLHVYENSPERVHLVIPPNPEVSELSDADLELVAGGGSGWAAAAAGTIVGCEATAALFGAGALIFGAVSMGVGAAITGVIAGGVGIGSVLAGVGLGTAAEVEKKS